MQHQLNYFVYKERRLGYRIDGNGPLVVLLHGFGETGSIWEVPAQYLATRYKVLVPDLPGSGASDVIPDMSIEGLAEAVVTLVNSLCTDQHTLIGHSMGGYIALAYAEQYPDRLNGLGLFHSTAYADSATKVETRKKAIEFVRANGSHAFLSVAIPGLFAPSTLRERPWLIEKQIKEANNFSASSIVSYYSAMMIRPDRCAVLKDFEKPILFVSGKADVLIPAQDLLDQKMLAKKGYFYQLEQAGHMGMLEEPEKTNQLLTLYLASLVG
jgi:pimeloyl-ACP methyl ester carboxylesterase